MENLGHCLSPIPQVLSTTVGRADWCAMHAAAVHAHPPSWCTALLCLPAGLHPVPLQFQDACLNLHQMARVVL